MFFDRFQPEVRFVYVKLIMVLSQVSWERGCGQNPGLDIISGGAICFHTRKELRLLNY